jgi:sugar phosphate isomerase/epimerase
MISRRSFIRNTALTVLPAAFLPGSLSAMPGKTKTGLQLYTIRDAMKTDPLATLEEVSLIGYTWLEAAGYSNGLFYGMTPERFRKMAEGLGLQIVSSHATFSDDQMRQAIDAHTALGVQYLVYPVFPIDQDGMIPDFRRAAERLNRIGEACKNSGIRFGYHNHDFEFVDFENARGYDTLLRSTEPDNVTFQADIYWMIYAGIDPVEYFTNHPGRFELWHVKDMKGTPDRGFAEVGEGIIPYEDLFLLRKKAGMKFFFVEQDSCDIDPLESIDRSYQNLKKILKK